MKENELEPTSFEELTKVMNYIAPLVFVAIGSVCIFMQISIYDVRFFIIAGSFALIGVCVAWIIATMGKRKKLKDKRL